MEESKYIYYYEGMKYQLSREAYFFVGIYPKEDIVSVYYTLQKDGWLIVHNAKAWDGASGPAKDTDNNMRASLVHDVLIDMVQKELLPWDMGTKLAIDQQYLRLAKEDGMWWFRRSYHFLSIQWNQWQKHKPQKERRSP